MKKVIVTALIISSIFFVSDLYAEKNFITATIDKDGVQRMEVVGGSHFFKPDKIIFKVNIPVELKVIKEPGIIPHDIVIHEPDAGIDISETLGKEPKVIKFTPKKVGKYPFYCSKKLWFLQSH